MVSTQYTITIFHNNNHLFLKLGPGIKCTDGEILVLKATAQATLGCLEECLYALQLQQRQQAAQQTRELSSSMGSVATVVSNNTNNTNNNNNQNSNSSNSNNSNKSNRQNFGSTSSVK